MATRKGDPYKTGELETILSMVPTKANVSFLSELLDRSESAIKIVYRIAYGADSFGRGADVQARKIRQAKRRVGIVIGRS